MRDRAAWLSGGTSIEVEGRRIWTRADGPASAPAIVFVHGFPTSSHDWAPVIERLADRFRCVSFDLLGFGASDKPAIAYDFGIQLRVLEAVAAHHRVPRACLVGHDYGATVVQLALEPLAPRAAVFLNGALDPVLHRARLVQRALATPLGAVLGPRVLGRRAFERSLRKIVVRAEHIDWDALWDATASGGGMRVLPRLLHYLRERPARRDELVGALARASVPLTFVWGEADPVSGAHVLAWARTARPDATFVALPDLGHYPQLEDPARVAAAIATAAS